MSAPQILASLDDVTVGYDRHPAIHHLRLHIPDGDMLAVVGPNGAGKSTFLKLLTGDELLVEGRFRAPDPRHCRVAYLPQINQTDRQFPITVEDLVASGLWHRRGAFGWLRRADRARIDEVLELVGMRSYGRRVISALSGGEFQRVRFAQLMLQEARMVVLDEPFVGIDMNTTDALLNLLARWHAEGTTIVAALHEQDIVRRWFPRTLLIAREMIGCGPTAEVLTAENWERALKRSAEARLSNPRWCEVSAGGAVDGRPDEAVRVREGARDGVRSDGPPHAPGRPADARIDDTAPGSGAGHGAAGQGHRHEAEHRHG